MVITGGSNSKQFVQEISEISFQISSHLGEYRSERSYAKLPVSRNGYVVLCPLEVGGQPHVAPRLPADLVTVSAKKRGKLSAAEITRPLQAGMTSSFTRCRRITRGRKESSK